MPSVSPMDAIETTCWTDHSPSVLPGWVPIVGEPDIPPAGIPDEPFLRHRHGRTSTTRNHGCRERLQPDLHRPPHLDGRGLLRRADRAVLRARRRASRGPGGPREQGPRASAPSCEVLTRAATGPASTASTASGAASPRRTAPRPASASTCPSAASPATPRATARPVAPRGPEGRLRTRRRSRRRPTPQSPRDAT